MYSGHTSHIRGAPQVVGFDVVELCPREGPGACAYLAAKLVYKLIGYATGEDVGG